MNSTCNKYSLDIVALKRPTALDKLAKTIPKPKGAIPKFGLPKWKVMPLESKIPMVPGPEGAYNFTRRKVGQRLWIPVADAEFNLSDPYCYEMKLTYDSLHDKHLLPYFSRQNNLRHLIKAGLIMKNLDAKCSLKDYNMYRKYLRRLHCDCIKNELKKKTKWAIEERAIGYAQEQAEKEIEKLKERENLTEIRKAAIKNRKRAEKLKLQRQKEKQQKIEERLRALIRKQKEDQRLRRIQSEARAEVMKQKQIAAINIRQKKIIQTFLEWNRKERRRKRTRRMRLTQEQEEKRKILQQRWEKKQQFQTKQIEKEQFLLKCVEDQRKEFIEAYNKKLKREARRMKRLLKDVKMYIRCYLARRAAGSRERICCEKYFEDDDNLGKSLSSPVVGDKRSQISKSYSTSTKETKELQSIQLSKSFKKSLSTKESDTEKEKARSKKKAKTGKPIEKQEKRGLRIKKQKGGNKRRKRRKKKEKVVQETDESEEVPEMEATEQPVSTSKTEISETPSTLELREKCRCQIIKDAMKTIKI